MTQRVSIVMPTYKRGDVAAASLAAVGRMRDTAGVELVVVDDGSPEEDRAALERAVREVRFARLLLQENRGPAAARNAGIAATTAPLVAFLDDDCSPAEDWLEQLTSPFADGDERLGAVGGRVLAAPPHNWVSRFCSASAYSSGLQPVFENAATANACYRRSTLEALGGFDEGFVYPGGDDPDLSARARAAGYRLEFVPAAIVYHRELDDYADYMRHMYRRGLGEARLARKQGRRGRVIARSLLFPAYLGRTGLGCWRRTVGKGGVGVRLVWVGLEIGGRTAFVAGSLRGLGIS